jgi:hypothetical protein
MAIETKSAQVSFSEKFHNASFISEYGKLESLRAVRLNTGYSNLLVTIAGLEGSQTIIKDPRVLGNIQKVAAAIVACVRNCDVVGMADFTQIVAILPETVYFGALSITRNLIAEMDQIKDRLETSVSFSHATFPKDGKTYEELLITARKRADERKESLWDKLELEQKLFWEIVESLFSRGHHTFENSCFDAGMGFELTEFFMDQINDLIIKEVKRTPLRRGMAYFSGRKITPSMPVAKSLAVADGIATKVYLAGECDGSSREFRNAIPVNIDDPRLKDTFFSFFLNENSGYALVCKENWGATFSCYHTSDISIVEGLINKFYYEYSLHEQQA